MMDPRSFATAAAHAATIASAELLRFARDGEASENFALEPETVELLCDALKLAIEIDIAGVRKTHPPSADLLETLHTACAAFLEGWA